MKINDILYHCEASDEAEAIKEYSIFRLLRQFAPRNGVGAGKNG